MPKSSTTTTMPITIQSQVTASVWQMPLRLPLARSAVRCHLVDSAARGNAEARRDPRETRPVDVHVRLHEVAVRLAAPARVELLVEPAREALIVADHIAELDVEPAHQPRRQRERGRHL